MTQDQINYICNKAHEITEEIWNTEHMRCFGNLELKMQEVVKNLTIPVVSVVVCPNCGGKDVRPYKGHYCCYECSEFFEQTER